MAFITTNTPTAAAGWLCFAASSEHPLGRLFLFTDYANRLGEFTRCLCRLVLRYVCYDALIRRYKTTFLVAMKRRNPCYVETATTLKQKN